MMLKQLTSLLMVLALIFSPTQGVVFAQTLPANPLGNQSPEKWDLTIPHEYGSIETLAPNSGPKVIHIQTAHGNYQAQKNIQAILHHLYQNYNLRLLLVEGSAFPLDPESLRFFPDRMDATMEVNDELAKKALVKGVELFLLEAPEAKAFGIEENHSYLNNQEIFRQVITQKSAKKSFLNQLSLQINRIKNTPHP